MKTYRWATLGCGVIANELAQAMQKDGRTLYGVANRTYENAVAFAKKYEVEKVYKNIQDLFEDDDVDIVYISTPHNTHIQYLREALKHGKHVLCEKSITLNAKELEEAKQLAEENGVVLAEAMTIYHMPLYKKLQEVIRSGKLGKLCMAQMNFGSYKEYDMQNRFFNPNFLLMNPAGEMATIALTLHAKQPKRGMLAFENGYVEIYDYPRAEKAVITYTEDASQEVIECGSTKDALWYEVNDMEEAVSGAADEMHFDYTVDVMNVMTEIRKAWGLSYPEERESL